MSALVTLTVTSRLPPAGCAGLKRMRVSNSLNTPGAGVFSKVATNSSLLPAGSIFHSPSLAASGAPASSRPHNPRQAISLLMMSGSREHPDEHLVVLREMMPQGRADVDDQHHDQRQGEPAVDQGEALAQRLVRLHDGGQRHLPENPERDVLRGVDDPAGEREGDHQQVEQEVAD